MANWNLWAKAKGAARKLAQPWEWEVAEKPAPRREPRVQPAPRRPVGGWPQDPGPAPAGAPGTVGHVQPEPAKAQEAFVQNPAPLEAMEQARADIVAISQKAYDATSGAWGPPTINEYQKEMRALARSCALKGPAREAGAKALVGLAKGYIYSVQVTGGDGDGEKRWRVGVKDRLAEHGDLPQGPEREGAAWAARAHFAAMEKGVEAYEGASLESLDWQGWQMHLEDCLEAGLVAARGIAKDFTDNIWSGVCYRHINWSRGPDKAQEWDSRRQARDAFELMAILALRACWLGMGGAVPDGAKIALSAVAQEELWVGVMKKLIAKKKEQGKIEGGEPAAAFIENALVEAAASCEMMGRAAASTQAGREQILDLASKMRESFASLGVADTGRHWAGMEKSAKALRDSPWLVAIVVAAAKSSPELMVMRDRSGETVGGLLNAALAAAKIDEGGDAKRARSRLAMRWLEEGVCDLLALSPDGASMLVPVVDFMTAAASDAVRVRAEQVEIARAMAPEGPGESPKSEAKRL